MPFAALAPLADLRRSFLAPSRSSQSSSLANGGVA